MVEMVRMAQLNFSYALSTKTTLRHLSVTVNVGDFIVLVGSSGSGKTTLLRQFKPELLPAGTQGGQCYFKGQQFSKIEPLKSVQQIGFVFQNPNNQAVMSTVAEELAFSLENIGEQPRLIEKRIAELANYLGIQDLLHQDINDLSNGQRQLVNLAAVLIMQPELLLLDEPTAQLDPIATKSFFNLLHQIHQELGVTIIIIEHQLNKVLPLANRLWLLQNGELIYDGNVDEGIGYLWHQESTKEFLPAVPRLLVETHHGTTHLPLTVISGRHYIQQKDLQFELCQSVEDRKFGKSFLIGKNLSFQYSADTPLIIDDCQVLVQQGEWLSILGKNGIGKTTLLKVLAGLERPRRGTVLLDGTALLKIPSTKRYRQLGFLPQTPADLFNCETVREELASSGNQTDLATLSMTFGISELLEQNPMDCSAGQQQLIALALIILEKPQLLILDEPTKGLDPNLKMKLGQQLKQLQQNGATIIMASHDIEFCARFSTCCSMLFDGHLIATAAPRPFFSQNYFYTTDINRLLREQVPTALNWEDVRDAD